MRTPLARTLGALVPRRARGSLGAASWPRIRASVRPAAFLSTTPAKSGAKLSRPAVLMTTRTFVEGREVAEDLGTISAGHVRTRNIFLDLWTALRAAAGGENRAYSDLVQMTTDEALRLLRTRAEEKGADAVLNVKLECSTVMNRMVLGMHANVIAVGTAVKLRPGRASAER